jgi:hypothetical protein
MSETFAGHIAIRYFWLLDAGMIFLGGALWMLSAGDMARDHPTQDCVVWALALVCAFAWVLYAAYTIPVPVTR